MWLGFQFTRIWHLSILIFLWNSVLMDKMITNPTQLSLFLITVVVTLSSETPCATDSDCHSISWGFICLQNICTCPSNHTKLELDSGIKFCIQQMQPDILTSCEGDDCYYRQENKCQLNSTNSCFECSSPNSLYNDGKFTCWNKSGSNCALLLRGYNDSYHAYTRCPPDFMICEDNSEKCLCHPDSLFKVRSFHGELTDCLPRLRGDCTLNQICLDDPDSYGYTRCSNGMCVCDIKSVYDEATQVCRTGPHGKCARDEHCPENSECYNKKCRCNPNFVPESSRKCVRNMYGMKCESAPGFDTKKALDEQGLMCINDRYRCQFSTQEYFDSGDFSKEWKEWRHICVTVVGGKCKLRSRSIEGDGDDYVGRCVDNASCVETVESIEGDESRCQCNPGYRTTEEDRCEKYQEFGGNCTDNCDSYAGLVCKESKCQCPDEEIMFSEEQKRCLSPEGHFCGDFTLQKGDTFSKVVVECESGLECSWPKRPEVSRKKCMRI